MRALRTSSCQWGRHVLGWPKAGLRLRVHTCGFSNEVMCRLVGLGYALDWLTQLENALHLLGLGLGRVLLIPRRGFLLFRVWFLCWMFRHVRLLFLPRIVAGSRMIVLQSLARVIVLSVAYCCCCVAHGCFAGYGCSVARRGFCACKPPCVADLPRIDDALLRTDVMARVA